MVAPLRINVCVYACMCVMSVVAFFSRRRRHSHGLDGPALRRPHVDHLGELGAPQVLQPFQARAGSSSASSPSV